MPGEDEFRVFPPDSQIWRLSRENALLLGGPAAAILQVAHPAIAAGVANHSEFRSDTLGRLHRTLETIYIVAFGTQREANALRDHVAAMHAKVRGHHPVAYDAFSPDAQMWVLATLIATGTWIFEQLVAPLTATEQEQHYREMRHFGTYFGLPITHGPQTHIEFQEYYTAMLGSDDLASHPLCAEVARYVARPTRPKWLSAIASATSLILPETIPSPVREKLGFHSSAATRAAFRVARHTVRFALPILPASLRFTPKYLSARPG